MFAIVIAILLSYALFEVLQGYNRYLRLGLSIILSIAITSIYVIGGIILDIKNPGYHKIRDINISRHPNRYARVDNMGHKFDVYIKNDGEGEDRYVVIPSDSRVIHDNRSIIEEYKFDPGYKINWMFGVLEYDWSDYNRSKLYIIHK